MNRDIESVIDDAVALISSLNSSSADSIPSYNVDAMKKCIININKLYKKNADDLMILKSGSISEKSRKQEVVLTAHARQSCIEYIKRCCCTYLHERMLRIKHLRWKHGGHVPEKIKENLCEAELKWLQEYNNLLADFQSSLGENGVNLLLNMKPPHNLFVKVRAKQNIGSFELSDGTTVSLTENALHSLPVTDCEMLIRQGMLELVE
uniref:DNA replication complex GINS protein PSF1 n=1 Tax=Onchocerca volvulus TaxID=6282 RepID=A0A8R1TX30_ONCVO